MKKYLLTIISIIFFTATSQAQGYYFGVKGGATIGIQKWNNYEKDPLIAYHGIIFIETASEGNQFALFAQTGYHVKGSALRNRNFYNPISNTTVKPPTQKFEFKNISLTLGGKQKFNLGESSKMYYLFGIRGDYTIKTNFDQYKSINTTFNTLYYPDDSFVKKWNYGVTVGGGFEFAFSDYISALIEFTVNPDFSRQYFQEPIDNIYDPYTGQFRRLNQTEIRNTTFEISLGLIFLHRIEYVDVMLF